MLDNKRREIDEAEHEVRSLLSYRSRAQREDAAQRHRVDDTATLAAAFRDGPGVVSVPAGRFFWSGVTVPERVTLRGQGHATQVMGIDGNRLFQQHEVARWSIRGLTLDGAGTAAAPAPDGHGVGISISRSWGYVIEDVTVRNFPGVAIRVAHSDIYDHALYTDCGVLRGVTGHDNAVGVLFDERGEYTTLTDSHLYRNRIGCEIRAGNVKVLGSNLGGNETGLRLSDLINGSHGVVGQCLINHNSRWALDAERVANGMVIQGCCFYYGDMRLHECVGMHISGGQISCSVRVSGAGVNQFSGNFFVPRDETVFEWSPSTILNANFSTAGPWPQPGG